MTSKFHSESVDSHEEPRMILKFEEFLGQDHQESSGSDRAKFSHRASDRIYEETPLRMMT